MLEFQNLLKSQKPTLSSSRPAAVNLILSGDEDHLELLFIRRSINPKDSWSGQMAFPGGKHEPNDENLIVTAQRETHEEVGISPEKQGQWVGPLPPVQARKFGRLLPFYIHPYVFHVPDRPKTWAEKKEVDSVHWIPLSYLLNPSNHSSFEWQGRKNLPCIQYQPQVIWGLSYMILESFMKELFKTEYRRFFQLKEESPLYFWKNYPGSIS